MVIQVSSRKVIVLKPLMMEQKQGNLKEVAAIFFKLGCIGFGGPAAHIAMMEREVVHQRKWITHEHFLDLIGATNLIPGPNSTEMAMHCGHERAGWKGLVVAGACFIFPAVVITGILAWIYDEYSTVPEVSRFIYGIKPAVIAVILFAIWPLAKKSFKNAWLILLGLIVLGLCLFGVHDIIVLFGAGLAGMGAYYVNNIRGQYNANSLPLLLMAKPVVAVSNGGIFWLFLKIGSILYGSGYVLFAFLDAELVSKGYISRQVLIDAVAIGQVTPGPVFSSATFIGWQMAGLPGAMAATTGIFLPSFLFVALLNPLIPKLRSSKLMSAFLDAVNAASIAVILSVCVDMGKETFIDWRTVTIAICSAVVLFVWRNINSAFIVAGGAVMGYLLTMI